MTSNLSIDGQAMVLLCTPLGLPPNYQAVKPLTPLEWEKISARLQVHHLRLRQFLVESRAVWQDALDIDADLAERLAKLLDRSASLALELERLENLGIWVITRADASYPILWKRRLGKKSPLVVYGAGSPRWLKSSAQERLAIVGSREIDETALRFTQGLGARCAGEEMAVVSGGARGVDFTAQTSALNAGGNVISVVSEGLEAPVKKREIRNAILSERLLMLSAALPGMRFTAYNAMARNKYVYALSHYAVVVASSLKGGTWSGALENLEHHWVPLFVRDAPTAPPGNRALIQKGGVAFTEGALEESVMPLGEWLALHMTTDRSDRRDASIYPMNHADQGQKDLFAVVWPVIKDSMNSPRSIADMAQYFNVTEIQMTRWIERAMAEGALKRLPHSDLIVDADHAPGRQLSLFEADMR